MCRHIKQAKVGGAIERIVASSSYNRLKSHITKTTINPHGSETDY